MKNIWLLAILNIKDQIHQNKISTIFKELTKK